MSVTLSKMSMRSRKEYEKSLTEMTDLELHNEYGAALASFLHAETSAKVNECLFRMNAAGAEKARRKLS